LRYYLHQSGKALWSQRTALLFLLLFVITFGAHRFGLIQTPVAMKLFGVAIVGAVVGVALGVVSLVTIWREGHTGAGKAVSGVMLGALMLAVPLWSLPSLLALPRIHEVTTDVDRPPAFQKLAIIRTGDGVNPPAYQHGEASLQQKAYPDIKPLPVNRPTGDTYSAVRDAVKNLQWHVVSEQPPADGRSGMIEAVDRSKIFGFTDDVVIRVSGAGREARVDVRSSSRHGRHDLGRNAEHVRELFSEVKTRLAEIEKNESMEKAVTMREQRVQKAISAKEKRRNKLAQERSRAKQQQSTSAPQLAGASAASSTPASNVLPGSDPVRSARAPSRSEAGAGQEPNTQQRRVERPKPLRKFWEQLLE
jgi:uncharacterized protein (DUF1499 family)